MNLAFKGEKHNVRMLSASTQVSPQKILWQKPISNKLKPLKSNEKSPIKKPYASKLIKSIHCLNLTHFFPDSASISPKASPIKKGKNNNNIANNERGKKISHERLGTSNSSIQLNKAQTKPILHYFARDRINLLSISHQESKNTTKNLKSFSRPIQHKQIGSEPSSPNPPRKKCVHLVKYLTLRLPEDSENLLFKYWSKKRELEKKYKRIFNDLKIEEDEEIKLKTRKIMANNENSAKAFLDMLTNVKDYYATTVRLMQEQRIIEIEQLLLKFR